MVRTYEGQCHCGAVRFRFRSEEITRGIRCNCSICIRRGAVMARAYVPPEDIELLEGKDALEVYLFGDRMVNHHFCRCLLYTSDAADERSSVDLGGRRIIKKKKKNTIKT